MMTWFAMVKEVEMRSLMRIEKAKLFSVVFFFFFFQHSLIRSIELRDIAIELNLRPSKIFLFRQSDHVRFRFIRAILDGSEG